MQTWRMGEALNLPSPCVVVLAGPGAAGKSTWAAAHFPADCIVSSDRLRAAVGARHKAAVLRTHCEEAGRDPGQVAFTHLSTALVGDGDRHVAELVDRLRPRRRDPAWYAASVNAGTVADHVGRFRELAEAGVQEVMVRLPDLDGPAALERMAKVISAFR